MAKVTMETDGTTVFVLSPLGHTLAEFTDEFRFLTAEAYCNEMGMEIDWPEMEDAA